MNSPLSVQSLCLYLTILLWPDRYHALMVKGMMTGKHPALSELSDWDRC